MADDKAPKTTSSKTTGVPKPKVSSKTAVKVAKKTSAAKKAEKVEEKPTFFVHEHTLVPEHLLVEEKEREQVLEQFGAAPGEFPKMFINDPAIAGLGVKEGDMIKIIRHSATAGETLFFRIVVNE